MKNKLLKIILAFTLAVVTAVGVAACGEGSWKGNVSLTNPGKVIKNGGFVIETENYVYFINGEEDYTATNKLGTPVKGALMVVEKAKLAEDEVAPSTVVAKVIASGDYTAGIYLFGDKLYYATPSTKKDTNGNVASGYLEFCSSDLAGNARNEYLTVSGNSTAYRFAEKNGEVFIIYYDSETTSLISYSTKTKKSVTIVESPAAYNFLDNAAIASTGVALVYTESVKSENTGSTEKYNKVFAYSVGAETAVEVLNGKKDNLDDITYAVTFVDGENVYFTATPATDSDLVKTYGATVNDLLNNKQDSFKIYNDSALVVNTNLFTTDALYKLDTDNGFIVEYSQYENGVYGYCKNVAKVSATKLLFKDGNYVYYIDSDTCLSRVDVTVTDANVEKVSTGTVVSDWYKVTLAGGYVFWLDSSSEGLSYVNYVATVTTATAEDTDDDGEDDQWYLDGVKKLSVISDADKVKIVSAKISALSSISKISYADGKYTDEEAITAARAAYDALGAKLQKQLTSELEVLTNYEEYLKVSKLLKVIIDNEETITAANKAEWQAKIDEIKAAIKENGWSSPNAMLIENGMWAMQEMQKAIDAVK